MAGRGAVVAFNGALRVLEKAGLDAIQAEVTAMVKGYIAKVAVAQSVKADPATQIAIQAFFSQVQHADRQQGSRNGHRASGLLRVR